MKSVQLFSIDKDGFHKSITAAMEGGALMVCSHAFDSGDYNREYEIRIEPSDIPQLVEALDLRRGSRRQILKALGQRFDSLAGDSKFERFLLDNGIPSTGGGYLSGSP